jgi:diguanylate cyclase (GGDEF)-like protein
VNEDAHRSEEAATVAAGRPGRRPRERLVEEKIRADLTALLFEQTPLSAFISVLVAAVLCGILWGVVKAEALGLWWSVVFALAVVRIWLAQSFKRRRNDAGVRRWESSFFVTLLLTSAAWGFGGLAIMPPDSLQHQAVIYFFLMGLAGGAVANYSAHVPSVTTAVILVIMPMTLWFAFEDSPLARAMAFGAALYVIASLRAARALAVTLRRSYRLAHELDIAREDAEQQARTDELTGMRNRRAFYELGEFALSQAVRYAHPVSVIVLDIDHFKRINDTWGHAAGDETLRLVALIIQRTVRTSDIAGRVGGEEFAILLPRATAADAAAMAERLRVAMARAPLWHDKGEIHFTASFGVAEADGPTTLDRLLDAADAALYRAKEQGRDRVVTDEPRAA